MQETTHQAKMVTVILDQIRPGQNRFLAFSTFTFKQGQTTKSDQINNFQCILYTFAMNFKLNVIYSIHSGDGIQSYLANKVFFLGTLA